MPQKNKRPFRNLLLAFCTVVICTVLLGFAINLLQTPLQDWLNDKLGKSYTPVICIILALTIVISILIYLIINSKSEETTSFTNQDETPIDLNDRKRCLSNLKGLYSNRLRDKMNRELNFEITLNLTYTTEGSSPHTVHDFFIIKDDCAAEEFDRLFEKYTKSLWRLLILGEPGAGKSILLLRFALKLIELAEQNPDFPIPVIFDLAAWKNEDQDFSTWIIRNLQYLGGTYSISKAYANTLVENNIILPLLDGFDEIRGHYRDSFFQQLTPFLDKIKNARKQILPETIICSRIDEYKAADDAPVFAAIKIQPLTRANIDSVLERLANQNVVAAKRLQDALKDKPERYETITSAYFVHTLLDLFQQAREPLQWDSKDVNQQNITAQYVQTEIKKITGYNTGKSMIWVGWLAWMLKYHTTNVSFELIDLQPDWARGKYLLSLIGFLISASLIFLLFFGILKNMAHPLFLNISLAIALGIMYSNFRKIETEEIRRISLKNFSLKIFTRHLSKTFVEFICVSLCIIVFYSVIFSSYPIFFNNPFMLLSNETAHNIQNTKPINQTGLIFIIIRRLATFLLYCSTICSLIASFLTSVIKVNSLPKITNPYSRLFAEFWTSLIPVFSLMIPGYIIAKLIVSIFDDSGYFLFMFIVAAFCYAQFDSPLLKHYCLRLTLSARKTTPIDLVRFLNCVSSTTGIMTNDSGKWRFRHQFIIDYLATWFEQHHPHLLPSKLLAEVQRERAPQAAD